MTTIVRRRPARGIATGEHVVIKAGTTPDRSTRPNARPAIPKNELLAAISRDILDLKGVSALTGDKASTLSIYHRRGDMPAPDIRKGQSPLWHRETIVEWNAGRRKTPQTVAK